ncbi:9507_t:CDS:2 [Cetraspora pellucida]|uniref:9507_t:CDS:1 n=1 Tax=Cetraspora pellucida TaxID=1433469 RepID=A0ACA9K1G3_9GLOM|nr:9507_t:CDS:2 [Cetraspora pellucida]
MFLSQKTDTPSITMFLRQKNYDEIFTIFYSGATSESIQITSMLIEKLRNSHGFEKLDNMFK